MICFIPFFRHLLWARISCLKRLLSYLVVVHSIFGRHHWHFPKISITNGKQILTNGKRMPILFGQQNKHLHWNFLGWKFFGILLGRPRILFEFCCPIQWKSLWCFPLLPHVLIELPLRSVNRNKIDWFILLLLLFQGNFINCLFSKIDKKLVVVLTCGMCTILVKFSYSFIFSMKLVDVIEIMNRTFNHSVLLSIAFFIRVIPMFDLTDWSRLLRQIAHYQAIFQRNLWR